MAFKIPNVADVVSGEEPIARLFAQDVDALVAAYEQTGVIAGGGLTISSATQLTVASGRGRYRGEQFDIGTSIKTITLPSAGNTRIDLLSVDPDDGSIQHTQGTQTTGEPLPPALPAGDVLLHRIFVDGDWTNLNDIDDVNDFDRRVFPFYAPDKEVIYVDPDDGANTNDGLSWEAPLETLAQAVTNATAGDTIVFRGTILCNNVQISKDDLTLEGIGWGRSVLQLNATTNHILDVTAQGFTARNFELNGNSLVASRGIYLDRAGDGQKFWFHDLYFHDFESQPILNASGSSIVVRDLWIDRCHFKDTGWYVFDADGDIRAFRFTNNLLEDCADTTGDSWMRLAVASTSSMRGALISGNMLYSSSSHRTANHWIESPANVTLEAITITNNTVFAYSTGQFSAGLFDLNNDNIAASDNYQVDHTNGLQLRGKNIDNSYAKKTSTALTLGLVHGHVTVTASVTITLPDVSDYEGKMYMVQRDTSAGNVTVSRGGTDQIDYDGTLQNTVVLGTDHASVGLYSDGTNWRVSGTRGTVT